MPSTTPIVGTGVADDAAARVSNSSPASPSRAKPWFCAVTATFDGMVHHRDVDAAVAEGIIL